jgi:hypothetical protein
MPYGVQLKCRQDIRQHHRALWSHSEGVPDFGLIEFSEALLDVVSHAAENGDFLCVSASRLRRIRKPDVNTLPHTTCKVRAVPVGVVADGNCVVEKLAEELLCPRTNTTANPSVRRLGRASSTLTPGYNRTPQARPAAQPTRAQPGALCLSGHGRLEVSAGRGHAEVGPRAAAHNSINITRFRGGRVSPLRRPRLAGTPPVRPRAAP